MFALMSLLVYALRFHDLQDEEGEVHERTQLAAK